MSKTQPQKIKEGTPYWKLNLGTLLVDIVIKAKKPVKGFPIGQLEKRIGDFIEELLKSEKEKLLERIGKKIEKLKYEDRDFLGQDEPEMVGMRMRNLILDQALESLKEEIKKELKVGDN